MILSELWPTQEEIAALEAEIGGDMFARRATATCSTATPPGTRCAVPEGDLFEFKEESTYIQEPPFFQGLTRTPAPLADIRGARVLAVLGDSVTTDHISPAGDIAEASPAGRYLKSPRRGQARTSTPTARGAATTA